MGTATPMVLLHITVSMAQAKAQVRLQAQVLVLALPQPRQMVHSLQCQGGGLPQYMLRPMVQPPHLGISMLLMGTPSQGLMAGQCIEILIQGSLTTTTTIPM